MNSDRAHQTYDYIIVGSGAGGGPLAARLAQAGKRVLVVEAGADHGTEPPLSPANEVSRVPGLHGLSTEHESLSWRFFVEHYERRDGRLPDGIPDDPKRHYSDEPLENGIFYPRASGVGGCTIHNAMITIAGPDADWDELAELLGDESWSGARMRYYFQRLEHCDYQRRPPREDRGKTARVYSYLRDSLSWLIGRTPDPTSGRHGFSGWLHTSVQDVSFGLRDRQLVKMLVAALRQAKRDGLDRAGTWVRRFFKGQITAGLDPNHRTTQRESPEGVVMIPVSIYGAGTTIHQNRQTPYAMLGRRCSPRELLHETRAACGDRLTILTDCLATKVLLADGPTPRAIGVRIRRGSNLYRAHVSPNYDAIDEREVRVSDGGEVILCGGAFNTPQLLMLSGIGERAQLDEHGIKCVVDLPGVGRNLQDRYEVSLVGRVKRNFEVLRHATFQLPDDPDDADPVLREWRAEGTGLYASNGAVLGIFKRSRPELAQPDLFIFGIPLDFRGYQVGYSQVKHFDRFSWIILKSHTKNCDGEVRLRSDDPCEPPSINFHYFNSRCRPGRTASDPDVTAIAEGVKFVKGIWKRAGKLVEEVYPAIPESNADEINRWIRSAAWGHHACGTCRMGPPGDEHAVLDNEFRVRGVDGLRVVDASIFPKIPGYFIVANIYMASEKAADVILSDARRFAARGEHQYPPDLFELERAALERRRCVAYPPPDGGDVWACSVPAPAAAEDDADEISESATDPSRAATSASPHDDVGGRWHPSVTGLAISGGGIRSATFNLGVVQNLARSGWLRRIDLMSTISGGSYLGACVGRLFDRLRPSPGEQAIGRSSVDYAEQQLADFGSPLVDWLRKHGNYIAPQGRGESQANAAVFVRNLLTVHLVMGLAIFALFGVANIVRYVLLDQGWALSRFLFDRSDLPIGHMISALLGPWFSPWFIVVELLLLFVVLPRIVAYWLVSEDEHESFKAIPLVTTFLVAALLLWLGVKGQLRLEPLVLGLALLSSFVHVELAWRSGRAREEAVGTGGVQAQRLRTRNYLTYDLGLSLALCLGALVFTLVDTVGHGLQQWKIAGTASYVQTFAVLGGVIAALAPVVRWIAKKFAAKRTGAGATVSRLIRREMTAGALAAVLFLAPLILYAFAAHAAFDGGLVPQRGVLVTLLAIALTWLLAHPAALTFVNRSSLAQTYAARLARAYLGASNPLRHRPEGMDVTEVVPGDDVASMRDYQPHLAGGPLHIISVTINQTVDRGSALRKRDRQGETMAVSPIGVTVGEKWHSRWSGQRSANGKGGELVQLAPLGDRTRDDHPLVDKLGRPAAMVDALSLRQWVGISGAAIDPGRGSTTNLGTALLMGLANLRTGYWWDSSISAYARDGFPRRSFTRRLLYLAPRYLATQCLILFEWLARYPGPHERFWHLSDGGYFENTGAYELVRRRVPRIILGDGSADPEYDFASFAEFVRKVRIDFGAAVSSFSPVDVQTHVPASVQPFVGTLDDLKPTATADGVIGGPSAKHAALCWVTYDDAPGQRSVLLYLKASVTGDEPVDLQHYRSMNPEFPHEDTADQVFEEAQWESYRKLGEHVSEPIVAAGTPENWFWNIKL